MWHLLNFKISVLDNAKFSNVNLKFHIIFWFNLNRANFRYGTRIIASNKEYVKMTKFSEVFHVVLMIYLIQNSVQMWQLLNFNISVFR